MPAPVQPPRLAVVLPSLPTPSETWIGHHLDLIRGLGYSPVLLVDAEPSAIPADLRVRVDSVVFVPHCPAGNIDRVRFVVQTLARSSRNRLRLMRTLNVGRLGRRVVSLQAFRWALALEALAPVDLVHCHYLFTAEVLGTLRRQRVVAMPVVGSAHGHDLLVWAKRQSPAVFPGHLSAVDALTFGSTFMLKRFERVVPGRLPTLQLLPLGIDHRRFGGSSNRDGRGDLVTILTVARLVPFKSVDAGLRAFALLLKTYPRARYVIAGDGWERASLESLARELRITEHVAFLGVQDEEQLTRLYGEADIFLFPSGTSSDGAQEGQGLALLEAQAAGLPVVATDSGGIPENMVPGRSGFLVREQAVEEMAGRLLELAVNPDLRKVLGRAGRTFVAESRSLAHWGRGLEALYKGVMGSTRTWQGGAPTT